MFRRRDVLKFAASGLAAPTTGVWLASPASAQQAPPAPPPLGPDLTRFNPADVREIARQIASKPYRKPAEDLPEPFANLSAEQFASIHRRRDRLIWPADKTGFSIEPMHRGYTYTSPMHITLVEDGVARALTYDADDFDFGKVKPPAQKQDLGFSGFRVLDATDQGDLFELAMFQGAGVFKAIAVKQTPGVAARALTVRTAEPKGEEFPRITHVWIEKPILAANAVVIHAILDSPSLAGAFRFTLRPGEATIIDTECALFARVDIDHIGVGAMQAAYLFGMLDRRRGDDVRPAVHEANGLQMLAGSGEWLWRPINNRDTLQVSAFVDENPRGFGLLQRERAFANFEDDEQAWQNRPSLWVEPLGDWGPGFVTLVEIPADSQVNQNIVAYWRPKTTLAAGSETNLAYRQFWCWTPPERPPGAIARMSRMGRSPGAPGNSRRRRVLVEFTGEDIGDQTKYPAIATQLSVFPGSIVSQRTFLSRDRKTCRVSFDFEAGAAPLCELRLLLESQGKPISETWLYRWTQ